MPSEIAKGSGNLLLQRLSASILLNRPIKQQRAWVGCSTTTLAKQPECHGSIFWTERVAVGPQNVRLGSTLDARNLCTFDAETRHESLLVKNESLGIIFQGRG